jgi:mono/diheme cytochrome c family protein
MLTRSRELSRMIVNNKRGGAMVQKAILGIGALMLLAGYAGAQTAPAGSVERGQKIFMHQMCFNCHGTIGHGGSVFGPKIAPNPFPWVAFAQQVRKPRADMPPYSEKNLPEQDLADIYAYLTSIKGGPAAKDIPLLSGF